VNLNASSLIDKISRFLFQTGIVDTWRQWCQIRFQKQASKYENTSPKCVLWENWTKRKQESHFKRKQV